MCVYVYLSGFQRGSNSFRVGNDGDVVAFLLDLGFANGDHEIGVQRLVGNVHGHAVHQLVLKMAHGIVVANRGF